MPRAKIIKLDAETFVIKKRELLSRIQIGELTIGQATKQMRQLLGMTQKQYAEKIADISPRILMSIEKDKHNASLKTLNKIARPFGLEVNFVVKGD